MKNSSRNTDNFIVPKRVPSFDNTPPLVTPETNDQTINLVYGDDTTESVSLQGQPSDHFTNLANLTPIPSVAPVLAVKQKRHFFHRKNKSTNNPRRHPVRRWVILGTIMVILAGGGYFAWKILSNSSQIFKGNVFSALTSAVSPDVPLKMDSNGNTNILLLGTSESDPNHPGAQLTDSIMIVSFNQTTHSAFLLSVPRDLWVKYSKPCFVGYEGKINAVYECALNGSTSSAGELNAETATANTIGSVVGVDINYVMHLNLAVIQKVVDAVGGIDITIDSPDPRGILDRNFDWRCHYTCYLVKYPNGPVHLSGTAAMWLAQARNDGEGYGLPRGNFDREANQRKIIIATKDKASSVGFLANPINAINLLDALGANIHTTIDMSEIKSFIDAAKAIPSANITSIDIVNDGPGVLTTGTGPDGSSIVRPVAGLYDYSDIQAFDAKLLSGDAPLIKEAAAVDVLNGSTTSGLASQEAASLKTSGFIIGSVGSAPSSYSSNSQYTLYDLSKGSKPATLALLKKTLGVSTAETTLPNGIKSQSSFVVIIGNSQNSTQN